MAEQVIRWLTKDGLYFSDPDLAAEHEAELELREDMMCVMTGIVPYSDQKDVIDALLTVYTIKRKT